MLPFPHRSHLSLLMNTHTHTYTCTKTTSLITMLITATIQIWALCQKISFHQTCSRKICQKHSLCKMTIREKLVYIVLYSFFFFTTVNKVVDIWTVRSQIWTMCPALLVQHSWDKQDCLHYESGFVSFEDLHWEHGFHSPNQSTSANLCGLME